MAAMLVMDVVVVTIMAVIVVVMPVTVALGVVLMVVTVIDVVVAVIVLMRHREHGLCLQRLHKAAALGPDQPGAEDSDQGVARDLDRPFRAAHRLRRGV